MMRTKGSEKLEGRVYFAIREYKEGKISIDKAAETAGLSIFEIMDQLTELGRLSIMF